MNNTLLEAICLYGLQINNFIDTDRGFRENDRQMSRKSGTHLKINMSAETNNTKKMKYKGTVRLMIIYLN